MWALPLLLPVADYRTRVSFDSDQLIKIARDVVVAEVTKSKPPAIPNCGPAKPVFVTIERRGTILGCRGSLVARTANLGEETASAARSAAGHDPRYRPIASKDLSNFLVTVTLVDHLETLSNVSTLTQEDGLVLTAAGKTGVVLPWEGKDPAIRLRWAYQKAGLPVGSSATLQRLVAERWRG